MLINADVKGLEIVCAAQYYGDTTLCNELISKEDIHLNNQKAFSLPSRLIAKVLKFRTIYGGGAYSFAHDPDFMGVSTSEKYWQGVLDAYFAKYTGIRDGHIRDIETVKKTGVIEIPSGRFYRYYPEKNYKGERTWPETRIKNYPIQGFGADLVKLARLEFYKKLEESGIEALFIGTVHDSLVVDTPRKNMYNIASMLKESIEEVPALVRKLWNYDFFLPLTCEVQAGMNKKEMTEIKDI
jgi:DNA polymerase-1